VFALDVGGGHDEHDPIRARFGRGASHVDDPSVTDPLVLLGAPEPFAGASAHHDGPHSSAV
jgi:hypothetical protein